MGWQVGYSTYGVGRWGWVGMLQLFEKASKNCQTDQRYPSFSGPLTEYDGLDLVTELGLTMESELELELELELSSLTTVTTLSIWMVMPMSVPLSLDMHLTGDLTLLAHIMSLALSVRFRR